MSALGNGSRFSEFESGSVLSKTLPSATNGGSTQVNMQSKMIGGKKKSAKRKSTKGKSTKRKTAKGKSSKKSISNKLKSMGKMMKFWK
jgi:hypothetical protein